MRSAEFGITNSEIFITDNGEVIRIHVSIAEKHIEEGFIPNSAFRILNYL